MKVYLAPMEGVVDPVLRELYSKVGGFDQMTTEFIRVTDKLNPDKVFYRYCPELFNGGKTKYGVPVYLQLLGGDPSCIADNANQAMKLGALGIDLNFGCPAKKVNQHDGGAALLQNPHRLFDIISAVKKTVDGKVPVSAKVRLGFEDKSLYKEIAHAVKEANADLFTIHARTKIEGYKPPAHWEYIALMKEIANPVPTVANGEIWTLDDYLKCKEVSGCEDVAIGRGAFSDPSLALQIKGTGDSMNWQHIRESILPEFVDLCCQFKDENYALTRLKQWTKFLSKRYPESLNLFTNIKTKQVLTDVAL